MTVFDHIRVAYAANQRADVDQLAGVLPEHVDVTRNAENETRCSCPSIQDHDLLPISQLRATGLVSRDFRDLTQWNRVQNYNTSVYGWPRNKSRGQSRGVLAWEKVSTIVLHTAGVDGMRPDRWLGVPCHAAVADDSSIVLCHELNTYLFAAHTANTFSCSVEIAGKGTISTEQVVSGRALLTYVVAELQRKRPGLPVYVMPHRFSHRSRARDCGAKIWSELGEWSMAELDLQLGPVVGTGLALPF